MIHLLDAKHSEECTDLVLQWDAAETLANADESSDPLRRVPTAGALVTAYLPDTDGGRPEPSFPRCAGKELLRNPLAFGIASTVCHVRFGVDGLFSGCGVNVVWIANVSFGTGAL